MRTILLLRILLNPPLIYISVGAYQFESTLADADNSKLTLSSLTANWPQTYSECLDNECTKPKLVKFDNVKVNAKYGIGALIKITHKNKSTPFDSYG